MTSINESALFRNRSLALQISVLVTAFLLAYGNCLRQLIQVWSTDEDYSHGFLIIPISAYLVWQRRKRLVEAEIEPASWAWVVVLVSLVMYGIGVLAEVATLSSVSMVLTIGGIVAYFLGIKVLRIVLFPLIFLLFMIPIPSQIYWSLTLPLQLFVSKVSVACLETFGVPAYRDGNIIHLPNTTLQVVQACSGLRSMISLSALSALFALTAPTIPSRVLVFLAALPISILVNIFRVTSTALISYNYSPEAAGGIVHEALGVCVFLLSLVLLYLWKSLLARIKL